MASSQQVDTLRRAFWLALIPGAILFIVLQTIAYARSGMIGVDSHAYWEAVRFPKSWYTRPPAYRDAFLYSPAFAQALWPLGQLPWPVFQGVWIAMQAGVLAWLLFPLGWQRGFTVAPFFITELLEGNVYLFFAMAIVISVGRAPGALALLILTKVTPGIVCIWFIVRHDWRSAFRVGECTVLVLAVSFAIDPSAWRTWIQFLSASASHRGGAEIFRFLAALCFVVWAARSSHAWVLAPAVILASPILGGYGPLAVLAAVPRLLRFEKLSPMIGSVPRSAPRPTPFRGSPLRLRVSNKHP